MAGLPTLSTKHHKNEIARAVDYSHSTSSVAKTGVYTMAKDDDRKIDDENDREIGVATKTRPKTKRPSMYRVLILNDDYTPMEFVVGVLQGIFNKSAEDAWEITMHVHKNGVGECGVFPFEVAETKVTVVLDAARKHQHPLQCVMEKK